MTGRRILVVDDEESVRWALRKALERANYRVDLAADGPSGLQAAEEPGVDLALLDVRLPGRDGLDVLREIRKRRPDLPVILCTGYSSQISEEKAKSFGIQGFAMKPLSKKELGDLIRTVLDSNGVVRFRPR